MADRGAFCPAALGDEEDAAAPPDTAGPGLRLAFRYVRLRGASSRSAPGNFLDDLSRYLPGCCGIAAVVVYPEADRGFDDPHRLDVPIHFMFQGGGEYSSRPNVYLQLGDREGICSGSTSRGAGSRKGRNPSHTPSKSDKSD